MVEAHVGTNALSFVISSPDGVCTKGVDNTARSHNLLTTRTRRGEAGRERRRLEAAELHHRCPILLSDHRVSRVAKAMVD